MSTADKNMSRKLPLSKLGIAVVIVTLVFVSLQLYVLSSVGTQGARVSDIRDRQAQIKIDNEIKRAKVMELQSNQAVAATVENLQMQPTKVNYINPDLVNVAAQQN